MYGGHLNANTISRLKDHILSAFSNEYCMFSRHSQLCVARINVGHQANIMCCHIQELQSGYKVYSFDKNAVLIVFDIQLSAHSEEQQSHISHSIISKKQLSNQKSRVQPISATFIDKQQIVLINSNFKLIRYSIQNAALNNITYQQSYNKILNSHSDKYVLLLGKDQKHLVIINKQDTNIHFHYSHPYGITSATDANQMLVVGDCRGKITLIYDFFNQKNNYNRKNLKSKKQNKQDKVQALLQWHTSPVLALYSNGNYIYSAGQESVVVLWHIRDLSRDFLPRIGTAIHSISIHLQTNQVICGLSDNSIKIVDLSKDKETQTYKTVINPKGYSPCAGNSFNYKTTHYGNGILALQSLPGRLQLIDIERNGMNTQLEIVPRNLTNSINEDQMQPHRINSFNFSADMSVLMVSLQTCTSYSYIKFFSKGVQGYQLATKIQNPHRGSLQNCFSIGKGKNCKFISFGKLDKTIRVWTQFKQKKKSIIEIDQVFWKCSDEISYKNFQPVFVNVHQNFMAVVYDNKIVVIYQFHENGNIILNQQIKAFHQVKEFHLIDFSDTKTRFSFKFLIINSSYDVQVWSGSKNKNQETISIANIQKLNIGKNYVQHFVVTGLEEIALSISKNGVSQLLIFNKSTAKFVESYQSNNVIQSALWINSRLIVLGTDLILSSLDGKEFIKYQQIMARPTNEMEQQQTGTRSLGEADFFKLNQRWVEKQSLKNSKKFESNIQGIHLLPNCAYAWLHMANKLLI